MPEKIDVKAIDPLFRWPRPWPWPEPGDPGPPWELIISHLDRAAINRLVGVQLELAKSTLEAHKGVLDAHLKALGQMQEIVKGGAK
jgi:hypothetical protein